MELIIGFSKPNKFKLGAWLISAWIGKPYSHVYIRYTDAQGRDLVFQAAHGMVHLIEWYNFRLHNTTVATKTLTVTQSQYETLRDFYYNELGAPYSYLGLISVPLHDLLWKLGFYFKGVDDPGYICSELCAKALRQILNIEFQKPNNLVRPDDIERALHGQN